MEEYYKPELSEFIDGFEFEVHLKSIGIGLMDFSGQSEFKMISNYEPVWSKDVYSKAKHESVWDCSYDFKTVYNDNRIRAIKK
jgi:hypothetical protein